MMEEDRSEDVESDADRTEFLSDAVPITRADMKHFIDMYVYYELKKMHV